MEILPKLLIMISTLFALLTFAGGMATTVHMWKKPTVEMGDVAFITWMFFCSSVMVTLDVTIILNEIRKLIGA